MFRKLLRLIAIILIIIAIIYIIVALLMYLQIFVNFTTFMSWGATWKWYHAAVVVVAALALAYAVDPEVTMYYSAKLVDGVKHVGTTLGSGIAGAASGVVKGVLSNPTVLLVGGAVLGYMLLSGGEQNDNQTAKG